MVGNSLSLYLSLPPPSLPPSPLSLSHSARANSEFVRFCRFRSGRLSNDVQKARGGEIRRTEEEVEEEEENEEMEKEENEEMEEEEEDSPDSCE